MQIRSSRSVPGRRGFTLIELAAAMGAMGLLVGILLPAIGEARGQAKQTMSLTNLRNLGVAHATYAAEWNDRQWTLVPDNLATYGRNADQAWRNLDPDNGRGPSVVLGWAMIDGPDPVLEQIVVEAGTPQARWIEPVILDLPRGDASYAFGAFRMMNVRQFNQYVSGTFYDPVFYAPDDDAANARRPDVEPDGLTEFVVRKDAAGKKLPPVWSSYVLSPAAMFNPRVMAMRRTDVDGRQFGGASDPWTLAGAFRSPARGQARYPSLKTHMIEHDLLRHAGSGCAPNAGALREGEACLPRRFNAAADGVPNAAFYDGHVEAVLVRDAWDADRRMRRQQGSGLWSRDTGLGADGYLNDLRIVAPAGPDGAGDCPTSFHMLTADGILGRDLLAN